MPASLRTINLRQSGIKAQIKASDSSRLLVESDWHSAEGLGPRTWAALKLVFDALEEASPGAEESNQRKRYEKGAASLTENWKRFCGESEEPEL